MKYTTQNGIHIVEVSVEDFRIDMCDVKKKSAAQKDYCNAGFFSSPSENGTKFTLPVAHLIADYAATCSYTRKYCEERGSFDGNKFYFDSANWSYMNPMSGYAVSTLVVTDNHAVIVDTVSLPKAAKYAISGVPIMRQGADVKYNPYVIGQGWDGSPMRATWHTFVGLKKGDNNIYVIGMKTTTSNMIKTAEAFKKFKTLGFYDVIKLDGGGSFHFNVGGKAVASTAENRRINTIILFGQTQQPVRGSSPEKPSVAAPREKNPYPAPTATLKKWNLHYTNNRWLQWQLTAAGYPCKVDGKFGGDTFGIVKEFQYDHGLKQDGKVGPLTRDALIKAVGGE